MSNLGYLYVIEFSNGTVKVGRSDTPQNRIASHRHAAQAFGARVQRVWVSDGHEHSNLTEAKLLERLPEPLCGNEWFDTVMFDDAVKTASLLTLASTDEELYNKRLMEAARVIEAHTGCKVKLSLEEKVSLDVELYFTFSDGYVMSSDAYRHYINCGGKLNQKKFLDALASCGVERRRAYDGSRLYGIEIPTNM